MLRKQDLARKFQQNMKKRNLDFTLVMCGDICAGMVESIVECIREDGLQLATLGTWQQVFKPSKPCRNPFNGEQIMSKEKTVVKYKMATDLKEV